MKTSNVSLPPDIKWNTGTASEPEANSNVPDLGDTSFSLVQPVAPSGPGVESAPESEDSTSLLHRFRYGE